jgi:hypothetical protein
MSKRQPRPGDAMDLRFYRSDQVVYTSQTGDAPKLPEPEVVKPTPPEALTALLKASQKVKDFEREVPKIPSKRTTAKRPWRTECSPEELAAADAHFAEERAYKAGIREAIRNLQAAGLNPTIVEEA